MAPTRPTRLGWALCGEDNIFPQGVECKVQLERTAYGYQVVQCVENRSLRCTFCVR